MNGLNAKGQVALHLALCSGSFRGDLDAARVLLEKGADANARDAADWAPLHRVAQMCDKEDSFTFGRLATAAAKLLLKHGADINATERSRISTCDPLQN